MLTVADEGEGKKCQKLADIIWGLHETGFYRAKTILSQK